MSTAQQILDRVRRRLNDMGAVSQWTDDEIFEYLTDAQRAAVALKPDINPHVATVQLVAGTKQALPGDGLVLLDVIRNMGRDGNTPGRAITQILERSLDTTNPDWHCEDEDRASPKVRGYLYDVRYRETWYVNPPQPAAAGQVELAYAQIPGVIDSGDDTLALAEVYDPAMIAYVMAHAHIRVIAAQGQGLDKFQAHMALFTAIVTGQTEFLALRPEQEAERTLE